MIKTFLLKLLCTVTPLCDTILFTGGECYEKYIIVLIAMAILLLCLCIYGWIKQESEKKEAATLQKDRIDAGNTIFSYYGKEAESFAESFDENVVYCLKYARNRETAMNYTIEDKKLIREVFNALTKVRVTGETDQRTEDFQDILTFELPMGKSCTLVFEAGNLVAGDKVYKISDAEDLWALTTQIALENEPEGHHENQHGDRHHE